MKWTELKPFTDYINILNYTGYPGRKGTFQARLENKKLQYFSQAEGCEPVKGSLLDYNRQIAHGLYFIRIEDKSAVGRTKSNYYDYIGMASGEGNYSKFQSGIFARLYDHYRKLVCLPHRTNFNSLIQKYRFGIQNQEEQKSNRQNAVEDLAKQNFKDHSELRRYFAAPSLEESLEENVASLGEYGITRKFLDVFTKCSQSNDLNSIDGIREFFNSKVKISLLIYRNDLKNLNTSITKGEGLVLADYIQHFGEYPFLNSKDEVKNVGLPPSVK